MPRSNMASLKESQKVTQEYKDHLAKLNGAHEVRILRIASSFMWLMTHCLA